MTTQTERTTAATFDQLCRLLDKLHLDTGYYRNTAAITMAADARLAGLVEDIAQFNQRVEVLGLGHTRSLLGRITDLELAVMRLQERARLAATAPETGEGE